jgi:CHAT domain-containing protein
LKTGLLMANDEMLTVADFFQVQLKARLVSLSACQTGIIGFKKGRGSGGFADQSITGGRGGSIGFVVVG